MLRWPAVNAMRDRCEFALKPQAPQPEALRRSVDEADQLDLLGLRSLYGPEVHQTETRVVHLRHHPGAVWKDLLDVGDVAVGPALVGNHHGAHLGGLAGRPAQRLGAAVPGPGVTMPRHVPPLRHIPGTPAGWEVVALGGSERDLATACHRRRAQRLGPRNVERQSGPDLA